MLVQSAAELAWHSMFESQSANNEFPRRRTKKCRTRHSVEPISPPDFLTTWSLVSVQGTKSLMVDDDN